MVPIGGDLWRLFASCISASRVQHISDLRGGSVASSIVASSIPGPALSSNNLGQSCLHPRASAGRSGLAMA